MNSVKKVTPILFLTFLLPSVVFAAPPGNFTALILIFVDLILAALPLVATLALLAFFWGMAKFIRDSGSDEGRADGKLIMKWGLIALFVAVSVFGILTFLYDEFGFGSGFGTLGIPGLPMDL